jgi:hypothetical protein
MDIQSSSYSPHIIIYLKLCDKVIRLSDVLCETARLYTRDFEPIAAGTTAELVFSIDDKESSQRITLHEGLKSDQDIFSFKNLDL